MFKLETKYLGKVISKKAYKNDPFNTEAIEKLRKTPKTVGDLRKLMGYLAYYRKSIKNFSTNV